MARMVLTFTPAGIERFFEETLERAPNGVRDAPDTFKGFRPYRPQVATRLARTPLIATRPSQSERREGPQRGPMGVSTIRPTWGRARAVRMTSEARTRKVRRAAIGWIKVRFVESFLEQLS
jgi:hypothetical protein